MNSSAIKYTLLATILLLPAFIYVVLSTGDHNIRTLPIYGPKEVIKKTVNGKTVVDTNYHVISDFAFINQYGDTITKDNFKDKVFVVDFFFTTCQGICPKMSDQMVVLQEKFRSDTNVMILSHTVNPEYDTVNVLLNYAKEYGAIKNKWHLVTGNKKELYDMARNSYFVTAMENEYLSPEQLGGAEDFIHSEKFILIDRLGRIRGFYDGTKPEDIILLVDEIKLLRVQDYIPKKTTNEPT